MISLVCPSCGGKLTVAKHANSLVCEHCGNEHIIRRENNGIFLEAHARCPNCGRNDKSKKVSAISKSESLSTLGKLLAPPIEATIKHPYKYPEPSDWSDVTFIGAGLFLVGLFFVNSFSSGVVVFFISACLIMAGLYFKSASANLRKVRNAEYKQQLAEYKQRLDRQKNVTAKVMKHWNMLYYCERDDCIFFLGENSAYPVSNISQVIKEHS